MSDATMDSTLSDDQQRAVRQWAALAAVAKGYKQALEQAEQKQRNNGGDPVVERAWAVQVERLKAGMKQAEDRAAAAAESTGVLDDLNDRYVGERGRNIQRDRALSAYGSQEFIATDAVNRSAREVFAEANSQALNFIAIRDAASNQQMAADISKAFATAAERAENTTQKLDLERFASENTSRAGDNERTVERCINQATQDGYSASDIDLAREAGKAQGAGMAQDYIERERILEPRSSPNVRSGRPQEEHRGERPKDRGNAGDRKARDTRPPVRLSMEDLSMKDITALLKALLTNDRLHAVEVALQHTLPARMKKDAAQERI